MAEKDIFDENDDFEKLLDSFINDKNEGEDAKDEKQSESPFAKLSDESEKLNEQISAEMEEDLSAALAAGKEEASEQQNMPSLGPDESELAQAFINFQSSVNKLAKENLKHNFECLFSIDDLYPNYKPSLGRLISNDIVNGWVLLSQMFPNEVGKFSPSSSDEEFLNFAEKLQNQDLQLAVISYVEILIDMESCELGYQAKLIRYQETHIKKIMYEEYLARKERQRKFAEALKKRNFPVDAERLISNYFRVAQKDFNGAYQALINNPAIFAPIDFSKIKPRFFGLIKVTPKDGIRINAEIGKFLKKLKI